MICDACGKDTLDYVTWYGDLVPDGAPHPELYHVAQDHGHVFEFRNGRHYVDGRLLAIAGKQYPTRGLLGRIKWIHD